MGLYRAAGDLNVVAITLVAMIIAAAADACAVCAAGGGYLAAGDGNIRASTRAAAADACAVFAAGGGYLAAGDGNIRASTFIAAADACTKFAAGGVQTAVVVLVGNGQIAFVVLLHTGVSFAAYDCVGSVQLDVYVAAALGGDGGLALIAYVNVDIFQGHVGFRTGRRINGDGMVGSSSVAGDDGTSVNFCFTIHLGNGLARVRSIDGNIPFFQIPGVRQNKAGDKGTNQGQREQTCHYFFHEYTSSSGKNFNFYQYKYTK